MQYKVYFLCFIERNIMKKDYDFSGWATRNDLLCSDGRIIKRDAFKHSDGLTVPMVWNHAHDDAKNIIGHSLLKNKADGVYAYCYLNNTKMGQHVKELIKHGDVSALSIWMNDAPFSAGRSRKYFLVTCHCTAHRITPFTPINTTLQFLPL